MTPEPTSPAEASGPDIPQGIKPPGGKETAQPSSSFIKNIKLGTLGVISFAIPVLYFLQASEIKNKELEKSTAKTTSDQRYDSLYRRHVLDSVANDTLLLAARLRASNAFFETYRQKVAQYIPPPSPTPPSVNIPGLKEVGDGLNSLANAIKDNNNKSTHIKSVTTDTLSVFLKINTDTSHVINKGLSAFHGNKADSTQPDNPRLREIGQLTSELRQIVAIRANTFLFQGALRHQLDSLSTTIINRLNDLISNPN